ncbi:MAG: hypothetical protein R6U91_10225 [Bacillota bacterium]
MGRIDRPKSSLKTEDEELKVIPIFQDGPYYARKGTYYSGKNKITKAQIFLQKAIELEPENPEHHLNYACLLSKTDSLKEANLILKHIVQRMDRNKFECYYFLAANYYKMGELMEAKYYASRYLQEDPDGDLAFDADEIMLMIETKEETSGQVDYSLSAVENESLLRLISGSSRASFRSRLDQERNFRRIVHRGLYHGSDVLKEAIVRVLGEIAGEKAFEYLLEFVANPWIKERLRQVALLELKRIDPNKTCWVFKGSILQEVNLQDHTLPAPVWKEKWQGVLDCAYANMNAGAHYSDEFFEDAQAIWLDFINHTYPKVPRITNPHTWAAGLEYCLARFHFLDLTQDELAEAYNISGASISRIFRRMDRELDIDRKAYHNMLTLLSTEEEED